MSAPVAAGTVLAGKYRVDRVIGEGGMGVVVLATDTQLERRVAIKFLLPEYAQHHEAAQRFLREARAAVKIQSEHVARVIDVGTMEGGGPYMVMEYLEGGDLASLIESQKQLPILDAVAYVLEACDAIAEAHSVGIVHRDLKPANLFLALQPDGSSRIKVLDFGISKAMMTSTGMDPSLTRTSSMMGSPLYMSPEQMKSAKNVDPRTDVWALGVILYELLSGEPPFYADSIPELSAKVLLEDPLALRTFRPDVPDALQEVVKQALAKDVKARYATVADLAAALSQFGPARTRANVERASRVLKISTTTSPDKSVPGSAIPSSAYARTAAAWTDSGAAKVGAKESGVAVGKWIGVGVALAAVLGGGVFLLSGRHSASNASSATTAPAPIAAEPKSPESPAVAVPVVPPPPAVTPAPAAPTPSVAAALSAPAVPATPEVPSVASKAVKPGSAHARPAAKKPEAAPAPAAPAPADPFGGFGNRK